MNVRIIGWMCMTLSLIACTNDTRGTAVSSPTAGTSATSAAWVITTQGIGTLQLGAPLVEPPNGFEESYRTSVYGDRQPLEGFQFSDPPVLAVFKGGPFTSWSAQHAADSAPPAIQTLASALAGAKRFNVEMLVVTDRRPTTEAGISVGDDYATFARAYPRAPAPDAYRGLWEQPSCMVSRDTIWFFFDRCDDADNAKIIRIAVRTDGSKV